MTTVWAQRKTWETAQAPVAPEAASEEPDATPATPEAIAEPHGKTPEMAVNVANTSVEDNDGADLDIDGDGESPAAPEAAGEPRSTTQATPEAASESLGTTPETPANVASANARALDPAAVRSGANIQHAGTLLMIAVVARMGLHACLEKLWTHRTGRKTLRIVTDAVIAALALGEACVEGVRRLATPTAGLLLRASRAPSASWVRRMFHRFADGMGSLQLHLTMAGELLRVAHDNDDEPAVFYVDNHLRPYAGKFTVRRGWRMQDKRVRPGTTDYWVHDEDGRPVMRVDVTTHDSLAQWLTPIAELMRQGLGQDTRILLAFDRAGAYPEQMAELRNRDFEFVTYERRPYQLLAANDFDRSICVGDEVLGLHESRFTNLKAGRGRVRRIALRKPDGKQINLLASSTATAERLVELMLGARSPVEGVGARRTHSSMASSDGASISSTATRSRTTSPRWSFPTPLADASTIRCAWPRCVRDSPATS
ncbi:MAG: hypothetical protein MJE77_23065 [Proteobacteria bacterium]|nr:hypothetical protein [Pseudomonadota bacterium]